MNDTTTFWALASIGGFLLIAIVIVANVIKNLMGNKEIWQNKRDQDKKGMMTLLFLLSAGAANATSLAVEAPSSAPLIVVDDTAFWTVLSIDSLLLLVLLFLLNTLKKLISALKKEEEVKVVEQKPDVATVLLQKLTDTVPVEREEEILTDHLYDGIRELDNNLPPWWKYGFYISILAAVLYFAHYHIIKTGDLQIAEYNKEIKQAERDIAAFLALQAENVDETTVTLFTEEVHLKKGKTTYINLCKACHGPNGEGLVGPNFTDEYWMHGGDIQSVFKTVKYGVPAKGMISWSKQLTPVKMQEVSSYILTLQGTNPPNQKEPQGTIWRGEPSGESMEEAENAEVEQSQEDS